MDIISNGVYVIWTCSLIDTYISASANTCRLKFVDRDAHEGTWGRESKPARQFFGAQKNGESAEINSKALSGYEKLFIPDIKPSLNVQSESILPFKTFYTIMMYTNAIIIQTSTLLKT